MSGAARKRIVVIVQARMGSSRLPGKVMKRLGDKTILAHCLDRCKTIPAITDIVCATVDTPDCDPIAREAERLGYSVYRGDERNVLSRYVGAARAAQADIVLRVTSDCPFIDPGVCGAVVKALQANSADFATNNAPPSFPHGLDVEVVTAQVLEASMLKELSQQDREHVMPAIRRDRALKKVNLALKAPAGLEALRWTIDTPEDLALFETLVNRVPDFADKTWVELAEICTTQPELKGFCVPRPINRSQADFNDYLQINY
jgi:spore coat polysaccharide biosynthesis protein SpsF